jgi:hypothetical protein
MSRRKFVLCFCMTFCLMLFMPNISISETFTHNFDLNGNPYQYLISSTNAVISQEVAFPDCQYWRPTQNNLEGQIIYGYTLPDKIETATIFAEMWQFPSYDPNARVYLDVSPDNTIWTNVATGTRTGAVPIDVSNILQGSTTAYVRGRVLETTHYGSIHYAQFLRTANGIQNPNVYQFQATFVPEPSTFIFLGVGAISLLAYAWRKRK